jgi:NADPH:quinone reductase-like Zn-dependent oxidoreductase
MSPVPSMHAVRAHASDPSSLIYETLPRPTPGPREVLVAVHATAITAGELTWPDAWPVVPAHDVSGVVADVGEQVTNRRGLRADRLRPARRGRRVRHGSSRRPCR